MLQVYFARVRKSLKIINLLISVLFGNICSASPMAKPLQNMWTSYIDGTVGKAPYYLYNQAINMLPTHFCARPRAIDFGSGSGNEDVELVKHGWDVTGIDASARSGEVIKEQVKYLPGHFNFQRTDFSSANLLGEYKLAISFFSLPFGNKKDLPNIIRNLGKHMQQGAVFAANFFGYNQTYVKSGDCYGIDKHELNELFRQNNFKIVYFLHRDYEQVDFEGNKTRWDLLDVIVDKI